jgi:hypothetical protein
LVPFPFSDLSNLPGQGGAVVAVTLMSDGHTICGDVERQEFSSETAFEAVV